MGRGASAVLKGWAPFFICVAEAMGQAFGGHTGHHWTRNARTIRLLVVAAFLTVCLLAIGVPLLARPAAVVAPPPKEKPKLVVPALPTPLPMVDIFMPQQRINIGTQLNASMFKRESISEVTLGTFGGKPFRSEAEFIGKYARALIMPGRPLMADQVVDSPDNVITRKIRPGYRAITVQVNNVTGIEGWGLPGTRVDVLWVATAGGEQTVTTIVKAAEILSVAGQTRIALPDLSPVDAANPFAMKEQTKDPNVIVSGKGAWTVTLLVTPEDGQKVFLASRSGELSLMLRGDFESGSDVQPQTFTTRNLLSGVSDGRGQEKVEGMVKARRDDGTYEEWSVIEGRVWRWDQGGSPGSASNNR